jgi:hypothetical protein
VKMAA